MLTKSSSAERIFADFEHIPFEGADSNNMLAYRFYDAEREVLGRTMKDHLRLAVCYWHSFNWPGNDIFGIGTFDRPWKPGQPCTQELAELKLVNAFDFLERLGVPFFCLHDVDAMAVAETPSEHKRNLAAIADKMAQAMQLSGVKLLWGTANLFSHPRYAAGAATSPDPEIFAWASFQVREMLETTHRLGGANYVLWGGREGYDTILNTDLGHELDQLGRFLTNVVEHKHKIGFDGTILIEPKPHEPAKHQYDRDVGTVYGFLKRYGLEREVKVNIEANHATLAGNSFEHEIATAVAFEILGSIDINRGDPQNGWDTDQFPNDVAELTLAMLYILKGGGLGTGGFNFDAKIRRQSKAKGAIILVMQRLHEEDMIGYLLNLFPARVLAFPAIAQEDEAFEYRTPFGIRRHARREGEALHPDREPLAVLEEMRKVLGSRFFAAQYLQMPTAPGGNIVKEEWFQRYSPADLPIFDYILQSWDTANRASQLADYSVCTTWGIKGNQAFLLSVFRKKLEFPDLKRAVREQAALHGASTILIEDCVSGTQLIQDLRNENVAGIVGIKPKGDKIMRLSAQTPKIEAGLVFIPHHAAWLEDYLHEMTIFPTGKYDDQVDSTAQALGHLSTPYDGFFAMIAEDLARKDEPRLIRIKHSDAGMQFQLITGRNPPREPDGCYLVTEEEYAPIAGLPGLTRVGG